MHQLETINKDKFFAYIYTEIFEEIDNNFTFNLPVSFIKKVWIISFWIEKLQKLFW